MDLRPVYVWYVKTYQGDSYRWYGDRVGFNIYEKCEELDTYMT